jgi:hypothetical protein
MAFPYGAGVLPGYGGLGFQGFNPASYYSYLQQSYAVDASSDRSAYASGEDAFLQAASTAAVLYHPGVMTYGNRVVEVSHLNPWTEEMYKRLVFLRSSYKANQPLDWITIATSINTMYEANITPDSCEQEYNDIIKKVMIYQEVMQEVMTLVSTGTQGVAKAEESLSKTKEKKAKTIKPRDPLYKKKYAAKFLKDVKEAVTTQLSKDMHSKKINASNITADQGSRVRAEVQSGRYYQFSEEKIFEGINYTGIGALIQKTSDTIRDFFSVKASTNDPFFQKLDVIEVRRSQGESISKEALYTFLGELAPPVEVPLPRCDEPYEEASSSEK